MKQVKNRLTAEERDMLLSLAWLNQREFARVLEVGEGTLISQLNRGDYKDLYITIGNSRKFDAAKVRRYLNIA